ncbi:MAG: hypothetical protein WCI47_02750 [bacterium]
MVRQKLTPKKPITVSRKSKVSPLRQTRTYDLRVVVILIVILVVSVGYLFVRLSKAYPDSGGSSGQGAAKNATATPAPTQNQAAKNQAPTPSPSVSNPSQKAPVDKYANFIDISSPQCGVMNTIGNYDFGIVGLNGTYMAFGTNPCLVEQLSHFKSYDLYVGANYPSSKCPAPISAYDCGVKAGDYNNNLITFLKLHPEKIWIDAEVGPKIPWSTQTNNIAYINGLEASSRKSVARVGYYSNLSGWNQITGGMATRSSNWYATGPNTVAAALTYCNKSFGGASTLYVQYVENGLDHNVRCGTSN